MTTDIESSLNLLRRGADGIYSETELKSKLASAHPLRIKLGMDPTAPDIHLGHSVVLRKMRQFQNLGHIAILIIGDYTARIGDPTGRDTTRPVLTEQAIADNARTYLEQAGKILDTAPDKLQVRHNSEWLGKLSFADVLNLTGRITVQQMLHRENFANRIKDGREIILSEFMYPLMQAYDSVVIHADVELGGTDQTFNNLMGRELMAKLGLEKQVVLVMPILVGLDGKEKMSKSKGNTIALTDSPDDMFGKVMSIPDALMSNYFQLLTLLPEDRIHSLLDPATTHPRDAKDTLARVIIEDYHGSAAARAASDEFRHRFAEKQLPTDLETQTISEPTLPLFKLVAGIDFASSNGEAKRLIQQGGVTWAGHKITDPMCAIDIPTQTPAILQVGKRRVCQIIRG